MDSDDWATCARNMKPLRTNGKTSAAQWTIDKQTKNLCYCIDAKLIINNLTTYTSQTWGGRCEHIAKLNITIPQTEFVEAHGERKMLGRKPGIETANSQISLCPFQVLASK